MLPIYKDKLTKEYLLFVNIFLLLYYVLLCQTLLLVMEAAYALDNFIYQKII